MLEELKFKFIKFANKEYYDKLISNVALEVYTKNLDKYQFFKKYSEDFAKDFIVNIDNKIKGFIYNDLKNGNYDNLKKGIHTISKGFQESVIKKLVDDNEFEALKNINFSIKSWDFFSLLWVNWAWKTTIIWILTDLVNKTSGKVEIFWIDIDKDFSSAKKLIWVVPQEFNLDIFAKVIDVLTTQAWYYWMSKKESSIKAIELLKELWLYDKKDASVRELSGWMKRRLMIARALVHSPKLLILDEPTAWIDINLRKSTYEFLQKLNKNWLTILLTTHYLEEVEKLCNTLAVIKNWEIIINTSKKEFFEKINHKDLLLFNDTETKEYAEFIQNFFFEKIQNKNNILVR